VVGKLITTWGLRLSHSPSWYIDRSIKSLRYPYFLVENHEFSRQKVEISNFYSNMLEIFIKRSKFYLYLSVIIRFLELTEVVIGAVFGSSYG
jgi:hypothetical protein